MFKRLRSVQAMIGISVCIAALGESAIAQQRVDRNVVYGVLSGLSLNMDVYYPEESNARGVILIPGSGWDGREAGYTNWEVKAGNNFINSLRDAIVDAGFTVFMPNHRMAPVYKYPTAVHDAQRAVRYVRHNASSYSIDGSLLAAIGHSSGGYLAAMLGVLDDDPERLDSVHPVERESSRVQAVVAIAAPHDLTVNTPLYWPFTVAFMGERPPMDSGFSDYLREGLYAEASPVTHVTPDDAAFMLIHSVEDKYIAPEQLGIMTDAVRSANLSVESVSIESTFHNPPLDHASIVRWIEDKLF